MNTTPVGRLSTGHFFLRIGALLAIIVAIAIAAGDHLSWKLGQDEERFWGVLTKIAAGFVAAIGAVITVNKYLDERRKQNEAPCLRPANHFSRVGRKSITSLSWPRPPSAPLRTMTIPRQSERIGTSA
jgi:hypothetical protein